MKQVINSGLFTILLPSSTSNHWISELSSLVKPSFHSVCGTRQLREHRKSPSTATRRCRRGLQPPWKKWDETKNQDLMRSKNVIFENQKKFVECVFFLVVFYIMASFAVIAWIYEHWAHTGYVILYIYIYCITFHTLHPFMYIHVIICIYIYVYRYIFLFPLRKLEQPHLSKALNKWWIVLDSSRKPNHLKGASLGVATGDMSKDSVSPKHEGPNDDSVAGSLKKQRFCSYSVFYGVEPHICIGWTLNLKQSTKKSLNSMKKTLQGAVQVSKHSVSCWKIWIFLSGKRIPRLWTVFLIPNEGKVLARKHWWIFSGTLFAWTERRIQQVFLFFWYLHSGDKTLYIMCHFFGIKRHLSTNSPTACVWSLTFGSFWIAATPHPKNRVLNNFCWEELKPSQLVSTILGV